MNQEIKKFWNARPCNIRHSRKEIGTIEYFNEVEERKYKVESHIPKFAEFKKWKNKDVLEIGCGIGTDSINFARNGANLTIIELSDKSLEITKKRFKAFNLNATFICGNAEELNNLIGNKKFDLIYSFGVIHHAENTEKIIEQIKEVLKPDGIVKIMLYSKFSWKALEFFLKNGYKFGFNYNKTIRYFAEAQLNCPVAKTYFKKDLINMFADYKICSIKKDHIFPYIISDYTKYKYNKKFIFKIMPSKIFEGLQKILGWHWLIDLKLKSK